MPVPFRLLVPLVLGALALAACTSSARHTSSPATPTPSTPTTTTAAPPTSRPPSSRATTPTRPSRRTRPARPTPIPLPLPARTGAARQAITVVAPSTASTTARLQAWRKDASGWHPVDSAVTAHLGSDGLSAHPSESRSATPIGSFTLTQAFGSAANPGTRLPYFTTDASDWWVSDAASQYYNTHYRCSGSCPFDTGAGENLLDAGFVYTYAVVIDYNRAPVVKGAGSAFFLHVTNGQPTAGCVSIPEAALVSIMKWLDPAAHPRIVIGVG